MGGTPFAPRRSRGGTNMFEVNVSCRSIDSFVDAGYERVREHYLSVASLQHRAELVRLLFGVFGVREPLTADASHAA